MTDINSLTVEEFVENEIDEDFVDAMDYRDEEENYLTDEDYIAGWNMTRAEVLGFENFDACYSTFDENDYEYQQAIYN